MILVRFSTVGRCMFSSVSSSVCQNCGKGVAMTCSTGTPIGAAERGGANDDDWQRALYTYIMPYVLLSCKKCFITHTHTFVKEGDMVVLHGAEVHILPEIRLL